MSTIITPSEDQINIVITDDAVNVNITNEPVVVNVTEEIIEISTANGAYPLPTTVYSVFGRTGAIIAQEGDYDLGELGDVTLVSKVNGDVLTYDGTKWINKAVTGTGTVTSVDMTVPMGLQVSGNPIIAAGTLAVNFADGYSIPTNTKQNNWDAAYNDKINSADVSGTTTKTLTLTQQDGGTITASWTDINTNLVTSVNGYVGDVVLTTTDIAEGLKLYYTEARVSANVDVAANTAARHAALTIGTANGLSLSSQVLSLALASASTTGALSSTDWSNFTSAYDDKIISASVSGTTTKTLTLNQQDGGTVTANWTDIDTGITSVGLTMPTAFSVANSPLTGAGGTLAVTGAGSASQYIRGDGQLATFPTTGGGGSSVNYYLNGSINASVAGYKQMSNTAILGTGTDFNLVGNGLIAEFLTDAGNPNRLLIPGGAWNFEMYFSMSSSGGTQKFYLELLKYNGSTFTTIASTSTNPEEITGGTTTDLYITSMAVPETTLLATDRLALRVYIVDNSVGRTTTLHTEDNNLCEIITTFSAGVSSLNGLTANTQYFAVGTSGMDFNINSLNDTHTFNIPSASATNRGLITTGTQTIAGQKTFNAPTYFNGFAVFEDGYSLYNAPSTGTLAGANYTGIVALKSGSNTDLQIQHYSSYNSSLRFSNDVASFIYTFPDATGTLALTSDLGAYVTLAGTETITGAKTFAQSIKAGNGLSLFEGTGSSAVAGGNYTGMYMLKVGTNHNLNFAFPNANGSTLVFNDLSNYTYTLPLATGTFALTSDIPSSTLQSNWTTAYNRSLTNFTINYGVSGTSLILTKQDASTLTLGLISGGLTSGNIVIYNGSNLAYVPLNATAPLSYNAGSQTFTITQANTSTNGYLSSTDWNTFNGKQAAGNYITALTGEATASGPGSASVTLSTSAVTSKILTGVNITGGSITATDSILVAFGKIQNQINGVLGGAIYQSTWNASTNSPTLTSGTGTKGYYYIVNVAGSTNLDGITDWKVGDWAIFNGTTWNKVDNTDAVSSVNGFTGAVSLTTANISEVTNLYYTEARVSANSDVSANTAARHNAVTLGTANGLSLSTQVLSLGLASTSATGALSSTDWNTFNGKQNALTNPVTGTGTTNYLPKFTGTSTIGNSAITDDGTTVTLISRALSGTSATFSGALTVTNNVTIRPTSGYNAYFQTSGTALRINYLNDAFSANVSASYRATDFAWQKGDGTEVLKLDASGNLGLGVTPSAWGSIFKVIEGGATGFNSAIGFRTDTNELQIRTNSYYNGSSWIYKNTAQATGYSVTNAQHIWYNAPSGTAGAAITFTQAMTLTSGGVLTLPSTGSLEVGYGSVQGTYKLDVNGTGRFSGNAQPLIVEGTTNTEIKIKRPSTSYGGGLGLYTGATHNWLLGTAWGETSSNFILYNAATGTQSFKVDYGTNAATFSSSVSAAGIFSGRTTNGQAFGCGNGIDSDLGIFVQTNNIAFSNSGTSTGFSFAIGGSTRFSLASTGAATFSSNVTLGTNAGGTMLQVGTSGAASFGAPTAIQMDNSYQAGSGSPTALKIFLFRNGSETYGFGLNSSAGVEYHTGGYHGFYTATAGVATERMRLTSGGNLLVGPTSDRTTARIQFSRSGTIQELYQESTSADTTFLLFSTTTATGMGSITRLGTSNSVLYNTTSDYRLKHDLKDFSGLDIVNKIKTYDFAWNIDNSRNHGVIAHELQSVLSYAVHGEKDGEMMQGVDYSKLTPILTKSVQELHLLIKELQAKLATLSNN